MNIIAKIVLCTLLYMGSVAGQGVVLKPLSLHILDTTVGTNAPNVTCRLYKKTSSNEEKFNLLATAVTNADGRITEFLSIENYEFGIYRIWFGLEDYFYRSQGISAFFPQAQITYENKDGSASHFPLVISPFSVSTYKGS